MAQEITILHISDLHLKVSEKAKIQMRMEPLFNDIESLDCPIDIVTFTGDIAFSGMPEEYALADELLFQPLLHRFHLTEKKFFFIPGNHDVNRQLIEPMEEAGLKKSLKTSEAASAALKKGFGSERLSGYTAFSKSHATGSPNTFASHIHTIGGMDIGIACLDSAWRCSGDQDQGKLFLTYEQVNVLADALDNCALRIALVHHPFDWFHTGENDILEDLKRRFEITLSGHLHRQTSIAEQTTSHNSLFLAAPAVYAGAHGDGYNVYHINLQNRTFTANFRKYVRGRNDFDKDTAHARDGAHQFDLPVRDMSKLTNAVMIQRIVACKTKLQDDVKHRLQLIQKIDNPVLVTPKIAKVCLSGGEKLKIPIRTSLNDIAQTSSVIFGPLDSGKTILLQMLTSDLSDKRTADKTARLPIYVHVEEVTAFGCKKSIVEYLESIISKEFPGETLRHAIICLDGLSSKHLGETGIISELGIEQDLVFIIAIDNEIMFDALMHNPSFKSYSFYELSHWGPSRIREFVVKYFENTSIDVDAAYNFVSSSLQDTDIPATPWIVALYLSIFPTLGRQVSSLSYVRLLEKIEEHRLGQVETSAADSLYNKRQILMRLACSCFNQSTITIKLKEFDVLIETFFSKIMLPVDVKKYVHSLNDSGLIIVSDDNVRFSYFAFYDYFLARAFERKIIDPESILTSLKGCLSVGQALSVYGGLFRENSKIAETVLSHVGAAFKGKLDFAISDLEKYINDLLFKKDAKTVDEVADADLKKRIDYEQYDEDFDERKSAQAQARARQLHVVEPTCQLEELGIRTRALKVFYNLFRNLENISGTEKVDLLDKVLDFHISMNLDYIEFIHKMRGKDAGVDFKTFSAYIVTIGGQIFLSSNIGTQSLQEAILATLKSTKNDLKRLLLLCLYGDLRLSGYQGMFQEYVKDCDTLVAVELIYMQIRMLLITHDSLQVPASTISAFQAAFKRRQQLYGSRTSRGAYDKEYSHEIESAKRQHLQYFNAQEALLRASNYA